MNPFTILTPGDGNAAVTGDGSTVRLHGEPGAPADRHLYRDGLKWVVDTVWLGAARLGIYGKNIFAQSGDGSIWRLGPTGWIAQTDLTAVDPLFLSALKGTDEPT